MLHIPSAIVYFMLSSVMVFGNKYLLNAWKFNYPIFIILIQIVVTVLFLASFNQYFRQSFSTYEFFKNIKNLKYQCLTALFYSLHSITALKALVGLNIPIYTTFKRCVPIVNLMLSYVMFKNKDNKQHESKFYSKINLTIFAMTFGVIIAGIGDLKFDFHSYLYCGFSVVFQALYLSFIQKCSEKEKKESLETLYFSNMFAMPFLIFFFITTQEIYDLEDFFLSYSNQPNVTFLIVLIFVVLCGCLLCFSQIWCTTNNNAITTSVIGVLKSFLQTLLGMFFYDAYKSMGILAFVGILINLIFGTWYTYLKYVEKEPKNYIHLNLSDPNLLENNSSVNKV